MATFFNKKKEDNADETSRAINKFRVSDAVMMLIIAILSATCVLPFIHVAAKSLSSNAMVMANRVVFWPREFSLAAYKDVIQNKSITHSIWYSAGVTLVFTLLGLVVCTCAAYPLSRKRLKGRTALTFIFMIPMYFSAGPIPAYLLMNKLHLLDTVWVLILPLVYSAYNMLIMKNFLMANIPDELEEAAFLDGASNFQILFKVVLPLSKAIIATLALFYAVGRWNAYGDNMYYIKTEKLKMIQYMLYQMVASAAEAQTASVSEASAVQSTPEVLQAAAVMFITVPILCIYPFVQKYFVKGTMVGAVKG